MQRTYPLRGEAIRVTELEDRMALPPGTSLTEAATEEFGPLAVPATGPQWPAAAQITAFERAGWTFRRRASTEAVAQPFDSPARPAADWRRVYVRDGDNTVAIGTGTLVLRLKDDIGDREARELLEQFGLSTIDRLKLAPHLYVVGVEGGRHPFDVAWALTADPRVQYAEPQLIEHLPSRNGDPGFAKQWQWRNTGQSGGEAGVDVAAEDAWAITTGRNVAIAIIDHGFHLTTEDLAARTSDGAGRYDGLEPQKITFTRTRNLPRDAHGTFCASLAVGARNNDASGCGIAPDAGLLPIACVPDEVGTQTTLARAIAYAADPTCEDQSGVEGADVISVSLGPDEGVFHMHSVLEDALNLAARRDVPVFWAVANDTADISEDRVNASGLTVAVGSSDHRGLRGDCAFGPQLAFLAPGVAVVGMLSDGSVAVDTGTSFAAPIAAGIAALIRSVNPDLSAAEVVGILKATCVEGAEPPDQTGRNDRYGHGRVSAARAVTRALETLGDDGLNIEDRAS